MAITNFIPNIWSESLYEALDAQYIGVANCSREYEGDIKACGSVVKICGVGDVNIETYVKNSDMMSAQTLSDTVRELTINRAKYFNFQIDDIDRAQALPKLMEAAMKVAARGLANEADAYVYSLYENAASFVRNDLVSVDNIVDTIIDAKQKLYENNVSDASEIVLEVSPAVATLLFKAKAALTTDNTGLLETGCIGSIAGCKVFVSGNIVVEGDIDVDYHKCVMRTKRAIAFAEQLSEIDAYRPEKRFADAVKGLHLYGAAVVYPNEMVLLDLGIES